MMRQIKITTAITNRDSDSVERYLKDITKYKPMNADEEVIIATKAANGDEAAKNKLIHCNLRFVVSVAKQYQHKGMGLIDLINEGNIGLTKAADKYDPTKGFKFISYAVWWIRQQIMQALSEQASIVKYPVNRRSLISKVTEESRKFEMLNEREPTPEEIALELDVNVDDIYISIGAITKSVSLDTTYSEETGDTIGDRLEDMDRSTSPDYVLIHEESLNESIRKALTVLSLQQRQIICLCFGLGCTEKSLDEIGRLLQLTKERVRQVKQKAITKLASSRYAKQLKEFL